MQFPGVHRYITPLLEKREFGALRFRRYFPYGTDAAGRVKSDVPPFSPRPRLVLSGHVGVKVWHPDDVPVLYFHRDRRW